MNSWKFADPLKIISAGLLFWALSHCEVCSDTVYLKSGASLEGTVVGETQEGIRVNLAGGGSVVVSRDQVLRVEKSSEEGADAPRGVREEYQERRRGIPEDDAAGHWELVLFCVEKKLYPEALQELDEVERLDPASKDRVAKKRDEVIRAQARILLAEGSRLVRAGRGEAARPVLRKLAEGYPQTEEARKAQELLAEVEAQERVGKTKDAIRRLALENRGEMGQQVLSLALLPGDAAYEALIGFLGSRDAELRRLGVEALGLRGESRATPAVGAKLSDESADVRIAAARALGQLGAGKEAQKLVALLSSPDVRLRREALHALSLSGDTTAGSAIIKLLSDKDEGIRIEAVRTLGEMKVKEAIPRLAALLDTEGAGVRAEIMKAIGAIGDESAIPYLVRDFNEEEKGLQMEIVAAVGSIGGRTAIRALVDWLRGGAGGKVKQVAGDVAASAVVALGRIKDKDARSAIVKYGLGHKEEQVRLKAVGVLAESRDRGLIPSLEQLLGDPSPVVREEATRAIKKLGLPQTSAEPVPEAKQ